MSSLEYARLFALLDNYSRGKHKCFVAEMSLNDAGTYYVVCFRPADVRNDSPNRLACRYVNIDTMQTDTIGQTQALPISITEKLDGELSELRQSSTGF
jgi:hypothetical protein